MREIVTRYDGECRKCGAELEAGARVLYERRLGVFCLGCGPVDGEELRELRTEAAERKAERLEGWAEKREKKAAAVLNPGRDHYSRDWAFITQPGRIPQRARWNRAVEREAESVQKAREMRGRAASLRAGVRVKGDAEARRERERAAVLASGIAKGQIRETVWFGPCEILRVNKKSVSVRTPSGGRMKVALHHVGAEVKTGGAS